MTRTHPLWRPYDQPGDEEILAARVPGAGPGPRPEVVEPDPEWPRRFAEVRGLIETALGERMLALEHVGSTAVPDLWAKPVIDVDLVVADNTDEAAYLPALEGIGCELRVREPEWFGHRCLALAEPRGTVHVWSRGGLEEVERHLAFRDWLRRHGDDRTAYGDLKRELAGQGFTDVMHYNNAKAGLIYDIYERIFLADPGHPHDPHPRS